MTRWLDQHLETFVRPRLGHVPNVKDYRPAITLYQVSLMLKAWTEIKRLAKDRPILLPGRDVTLLHVIASTLGDKHEFVPQMSGTVASWFYINKNYTYQNHFAVDTGFSGSVPRALDAEFALISGARELQLGAGVFDNRKLAERMESSAKYWNRGHVRQHKVVVQTLAPEPMFTRAAKLTQYVVKQMRKL